MSQAKDQITTIQDRIVADNDQEYPRSVYHETSRATGNQQWVADQWAEGALPTHSTAGSKVKLYTSSGNFKGYQWPDGSGKLVHYSHIQAIRTLSGLIIADNSCYARGRARCNTPKDTDHRIDVTALKKQMNDAETIYDITEINGDEVIFNTGRAFDLDDGDWIKGDSEVDGGALGL